MARLFEIVPTCASIRDSDGTVETDDFPTWLTGQDAEDALDIILEPYGESGAFYLDNIKCKWPGPWAFVALSREYDIADYVFEQRKAIEPAETFKFTIYDRRNMKAEGFVPRVGCFLFFTRTALSAAADKIGFLQPVWMLLRDQAPDRHWLVLLDEEPATVLAEAGPPPVRGR